MWSTALSCAFVANAPCWCRQEQEGAQPGSSGRGRSTQALLFLPVGKGHRGSGMRETLCPRRVLCSGAGQEEEGTFMCIGHIWLGSFACRAQQRPALLQGPASPQLQDLTFVLVKFHEVPVGPFLQPLRSLWGTVLPRHMSVTLLWWVWCGLQAWWGLTLSPLHTADKDTKLPE